MKIIVASKNSAKIEATREGFKLQFPNNEINVEGHSFPSGVSDQPMGSDETLQGAMNRALTAKEQMPDRGFWVGIEGGNIYHGNEMEAMAWIVILSKNKMGKARTAGFFLARKTIELIEKGHELGHADEMVFGIANSKQKMGSSGLLTGGLIGRRDFYIPAVIFALIPFKKTELYI